MPHHNELPPTSADASRDGPPPCRLGLIAEPQSCLASLSSLSFSAPIRSVRFRLVWSRLHCELTRSFALQCRRSSLWSAARTLTTCAPSVDEKRLTCASQQSARSTAGREISYANERTNDALDSAARRSPQIDAFSRTNRLFWPSQVGERSPRHKQNSTSLRHELRAAAHEVAP